MHALANERVRPNQKNRVFFSGGVQCDTLSREPSFSLSVESKKKRIRLTDLVRFQAQREPRAGQGSPSWNRSIDSNLLFARPPVLSPARSKSRYSWAFSRIFEVLLLGDISRGWLGELEGAVELPEMGATVRVCVEQDVGGCGVGEDRC